MAKRPKGPPEVKRYAPPGYTPEQWEKKQEQIALDIRRGEASAKKKRVKAWSFHRYFKDRNGRWMQIPAGELRPRRSAKPPTEIYRGKVGELRNVNTGRPVPKQKKAKRPQAEPLGVRYLKQHLEEATGVSWKSRLVDEPGYWLSQYSFIASEPVEYDAVAAALYDSADDPRLVQIFIERAAHVGIVTMPEDGARADQHDYMLGARDNLLSALAFGASTLTEWNEKYEGDRQIVEVMLWVK